MKLLQALLRAPLCLWQCLYLPVSVQSSLLGALCNPYPKRHPILTPALLHHRLSQCLPDEVAWIWEHAAEKKWGKVQQ